MNLRVLKGQVTCKGKPGLHRNCKNMHEWQIPFKLKQNKKIYKQQNQKNNLKYW